MIKRLPLLKIMDLGYGRLLMQFDSDISRKTLNLCLEVMDKLRRRFPKVKLRKAYLEILIEGLDHTELKSFLDGTEIEKEINISTARHTIKVRYDVNGRDMQILSDILSLSPEEIVHIHTQTIYDVHFIGFLPGFLYLGGMDPRLHTPRKSIPSPKVEAGTVAIGGAQTGIYPTDSPSGWYAIGRSTVDWVDLPHNDTCKIRPGDYIKFEDDRNN